MAKKELTSRSTKPPISRENTPASLELKPAELAVRTGEYRPPAGWTDAAAELEVARRRIAELEAELERHTSTEGYGE